MSAASKTTCVFQTPATDRSPGFGSVRLRLAVLLRVALVTLPIAAFSLVQTATAQRPIRTFDPFYRGEEARRSFYDMYAITAELSYSPAGLLQNNDISSGTSPVDGSNPFGLNVRVDYHLSSRLDLGVIVDAAGTTAGHSMAIRWVTLKYFQTQEMIDYAIRLAVDPSSDGRGGFPQMDLAFMYTSLLAPSLSNDFAVGIRRIQLGVQQIFPVDITPPDPEDPVITAPSADREIRRSRALGWEVHMSTGYNMLFDPAGSNAFVSVIAEGGRYDLIEWVVDDTVADPAGRTTTAFRGGAVWVRSGFQIERPGYRFSPYLSIPLKQWAPKSGDWPDARPSIGVRLMLR